MPRRPSTSLKKRFSDFLVLVLVLDGGVGSTTVAGCRSRGWGAGTGVVAMRVVRASCSLSVWAVAFVSPGRCLTVGSSQYVVMRKSSRFRSTGVIAGKPDSTAEREGFPIPPVSGPVRFGSDANDLSGGFTAGQRVQHRHVEGFTRTCSVTKGSVRRMP